MRPSPVPTKSSASPIVASLLGARSLRSGFGNWPLTWRIGSAAWLALIVGIGVTLALFVGVATRAIDAERHAEELKEVARAARILQHEVTSLQLQLAATGPSLPVEATQSAGEAMKGLEALSASMVRFDSAFVTDKAGRMLAYRDAQGTRLTDVSVSDRPYFKQTVAERRSVVSSPVQGRVSGAPSVVLTYPLVHAGEVVGTLNGAIRPGKRNLVGALIGGAQADATVAVVLTDQEGLILAHPDVAMVGLHLARDARMRDGWLRWDAEGRPAELDGVDVSTHRDFVGTAHVAGTDWQAWRWHDGAAMLAPLVEARRDALIAALLLAAVLSVALAAVLRWQLRPIQRLRRRALHLLDENYPADQGWSNAGGEIGELETVLRRVAAERAAAEAHRGRTLRELSLVMSTAPVGLLLTRERQFALVSHHAAVQLGLSDGELIGQPGHAIFDSMEDYQRLGPLVAAAFALREPYVGEWRIARKDGSRFDGRLRAQAVDWDDAKAGTLWTLEDISAEVRERNALQWAANHDALTHLPNRLVLERRLLQVVQQGPDAPPAALLAIDLDRFKPINDQHGHAAGDAVLQAVARSLQGRVRAHDLVARVGGDEFTVLLEGCGEETALRLAQELGDKISDLRVPFAGAVLQVGASVGLATRLAGDSEPVAAWMQRADLHCYEVKRQRHQRDPVRLVSVAA